MSSSILPVMRPGVSQDVAIGSSSTATTNVISPGVTIVMLVATSACYIAIGPTPVATKPGSMRLPSNYPMFVRITGNGTEKIAVLQDTAAGTLTVTEVVY